MGYASERDYKKLAEAVATDFIDQQIPLNDSITKLAKSMDLNQEQVARLCEAANNATFTNLFKNKDKTASDRVIEFDIADAKKILGTQIKNASTSTYSEDISTYDLRPLQDEMHQQRHGDVEIQSFEPDGNGGFNKVGFELRPESRPSEEVDRRIAAKVLETLRSQKLAASMEYLDTVHELRNQFRRVYDVLPFGQFEKQACAVFGVAARAPLNEIRKLMNQPQVDYDFTTLAKTAGIVDDTTNEMQLLHKAITKAAESDKLTRGITKLESVL
jgi:hypothetical protein